MTENLKKATELLAKYGFAMDATMASDERHEIAILSACKTFLALSTDMPLKERISAADTLCLAAKDLTKRLNALYEACDELADAFCNMSCDFNEQEYQQEQEAELKMSLSDVLSNFGDCFVR